MERMTHRDKAELINAINNTLLANEQVGVFRNLKSQCVDKLTLLIGSIKKEDVYNKPE